MKALSKFAFSFACLAVVLLLLSRVVLLASTSNSGVDQVTLPPLNVHAVTAHGEDALTAWKTITECDPYDLDKCEIWRCPSDGRDSIHVDDGSGRHWCKAVCEGDRLCTAFICSPVRKLAKRLAGCQRVMPWMRE